MKSRFYVEVKVRRRMGNEAQQRLAPWLWDGTDGKRERGNEPGVRERARLYRVRTTLLGVASFCENFPVPCASGREFLYNILVPVSRFISMETLITLDNPLFREREKDSKQRATT